MSRKTYKNNEPFRVFRDSPDVSLLTSHVSRNHALLAESAFQKGLDQSILLAGLVMARLTPIVLLVPFLGGKAAPSQVKIGLALVLTVLVYPSVWVASPTVPTSAIVIGGLVVKEVAVGLMLGFVTALVFHAVRMAGRLIDTTRGETKGMSMVPQTKTQVSLMGSFLFQLFIVVFMVTGGHRLFFAALIRSFKRIPPYAFLTVGDRGPGLAFGIAQMATDAIGIAVLLAFPVIAAILLTNIFLALVSKAAPQINVFFLGMPLKALIGIAVVLFALDPLTRRFLDEAIGYFRHLLEFIQLLSS
ncbi:MAG: flagellar biosynthetic protein FliR [Bradymonadaceae bacterium]